jgi:hypothetical protein
VSSQHAVLLYLLPSAALALLIRYLAARHPIFFVFTLAGTLCHELAHWCVGWLTLARPAAMTLLPKRVGHGWEIGSVRLANVRWYNAAPMALAPLLLLALPFLIAAARTGAGLAFTWTDAALAFLIAPQFLACWPSSTDWRIALHSWPYALLIMLFGWFCVKFRPDWAHSVVLFVMAQGASLIGP